MPFYHKLTEEVLFSEPQASQNFPLHLYSSLCCWSLLSPPPLLPTVFPLELHPKSSKNKKIHLDKYAHLCITSKTIAWSQEAIFIFLTCVFPDVQHMMQCYGPCWEPCFAWLNLSMDLINRPSRDPSPPMPWWDKLRLKLHGKLVFHAERMSWVYPTSLDPYNETEFIDWTWQNVLVEWTNSEWGFYLFICPSSAVRSGQMERRLGFLWGLA